MPLTANLACLHVTVIATTPPVVQPENPSLTLWPILSGALPSVLAVSGALEETPVHSRVWRQSDSVG
jgi:hypothetical protein